MMKTRKAVMETYDLIAADFDGTRYKPWPDTIEFSKRFKPGDTVLDLGCGNGRDLKHFESLGVRVIGLDFSLEQLKVVRARARDPPEPLVGDDPRSPASPGTPAGPLCDDVVQDPARAVSSSGRTGQASEPGEENVQRTSPSSGPMPMLVRGDVSELPIRDDTADGAILVATLHHLPTKEGRLRALREARRCLAPGGACLLGVWATGQDRFEGNIERARTELGESWEEGDMLLDWKLPDGRVFPRYYHLFSEEEFSELISTSEFDVERKYFSCDNHYALLIK